MLLSQELPGLQAPAQLPGKRDMGGCVLLAQELPGPQAPAQLPGKTGYEVGCSFPEKLPFNLYLLIQYT